MFKVAPLRFFRFFTTILNNRNKKLLDKLKLDFFFKTINFNAKAVITKSYTEFC